MRILIAPDSFKGCLSAKGVTDAIERGLRSVMENAIIHKVPMADGGEGTVETLVEATSGKIINIKVLDPLGKEHSTYFGVFEKGKKAVIEMALASGLPLVPADSRNPLITTTFGTGQLIKGALDQGCEEIIIGIGGSATNDGGVGMAQALGVGFYDSRGNKIGFGGGNLDKLSHIDLSNIDPRINSCKIMVACDVVNPLCGPHGASFVYGPQKGATAEMVRILDNNLAHLAEIIKRDLGKDVINQPGAGAAGGLGAGLMAFCNAQLNKGVDLIIKATKLEEQVKGMDLVITGEGQMDKQSSMGKTPFGVAMVAKKEGIPVIAIVGNIGIGAEEMLEKGIDVIVPIPEGPITLEESMRQGEILLEKAASRIARLLLL